MTSPKGEGRDLTEQEKAEINRDLIDAFKEAHPVAEDES